MKGENNGNLFPRPVYEEPPQEQRARMVQSRKKRVAKYGEKSLAIYHSLLFLEIIQNWGFLTTMMMHSILLPYAEVKR